MQPNNFIGNNELDQLTNDIINLMNNIKVVSKKAEIVTKINYLWRWTTKVITQDEAHNFKG